MRPDAILPSIVIRLHSEIDADAENLSNQNKRAEPNEHCRKIRQHGVRTRS